jgi:hypothetical protein
MALLARVYLRGGVHLLVDQTCTPRLCLSDLKLAQAFAIFDGRRLSDALKNRHQILVKFSARTITLCHSIEGRSLRSPDLIKKSKNERKNGPLLCELIF